MTHTQMTHNVLAMTLVTVVTFAFLICGNLVSASEEIAQQENLVCTTCHDKPGSRLLTDQGKYYELMGSMDGFTEVRASFEKCTSCHVRKPGSKKLTRKGKMFFIVVGDMEGLREWVQGEHPGSLELLKESTSNPPDDNPPDGNPEDGNPEDGNPEDGNGQSPR